MKDLSRLSELYGELKTIKTPTGRTVVLRQQNGADDDTLTNGKAISKGMAIANYLASIIVDSDYTDKGVLSPTEVVRLRLPDAYYIMVSSRIFSLGHMVNFTYQWETNSKPVEYEEDLFQFIWDFNKPFPTENPERYIKPVSEELTREITLPSGKVVIYEFANTLTENYMANLPLEQQSKNQELLARNLKLKNTGGEYNKVENFRMFNIQDMRFLRNDISEHDPLMDFTSTIENPVSGEVIPYPVLASLDFFFPRGM